MLAIIKVSLVKQANHNQTMQTDSDMVTVGQNSQVHRHADRCRRTWSQSDVTHRADRSLDLAPVPPDGGLSCDQFALHPLHFGSNSRGGLPCLKPCTWLHGVSIRFALNHVYHSDPAFSGLQNEFMQNREPRKGTTTNGKSIQNVCNAEEHIWLSRWHRPAK